MKTGAMAFLGTMNCMKLLAVFISFMMFAITGGAWAHGTKHKEVHFVNNTDRRAFVDTYNGKDNDCVAPHRSVVIKTGDSENVKCHGSVFQCQQHYCY